MWGESNGEDFVRNCCEGLHGKQGEKWVGFYAGEDGREGGKEDGDEEEEGKEGEDVGDEEEGAGDLSVEREDVNSQENEEKEELGGLEGEDVDEREEDFESVADTAASFEDVYATAPWDSFTGLSEVESHLCVWLG